MTCHQTLLQTVFWGAGILCALAGAPLLSGIINKVKAFYAGRKGPSVFQLYRDIFKLLKKRSVYSSTTGLIFQLAPIVSLGTLLTAMLLLPFSGVESPLSFPGDLILFLYLTGLGRAMTVLGAMDTGSSFEGMGSSRECQFAVLAEGIFLAVFGCLILMSGQFQLNTVLNFQTGSSWANAGTVLILLFFAFYMLILTETCRVPVDDPETHLELTMIHEAMILDYSGPDLALIHYGAALKMWILLQFCAMMILPASGCPCLTFLWHTLFTLAGALTIGIVESVTARYRFLKVPQLLAGALCLALMASVLLLLFKGA